MGNCMNPSSSGSHNISDHSKISSNPGLSSASSLTTCSTNSTLTLPSYVEGGPYGPHPTPRTEGEILSSPNLKAFKFSELKSATRGFRPDCLIGEGGFGYVFKGWIDEQTFTASKPGSGMVVAVKKLKPEGFQGHKEWLTEVDYLGQLQHPNLVKLIGFCSEGDSRLLVYEYMPRGSLETHLFRRGPHPLSWAIRIKVAIGAAKGLSFLHDSESQVIYRDVKASNILLDSEFNAKLSDFGLAKDGPTGNKTHVSTRVMGTQGYAAPEYVATGQLKRFSLRELQVATNNFSTKNMVGRGAFGSVYKGRLRDGSLVAVRILQNSLTAGKDLQFQVEVELISRVVHPNILQIRGFCTTPTEQMLVYPFMANGSVASHLAVERYSERKKKGTECLLTQAYRMTI